MKKNKIGKNGGRGMGQILEGLGSVLRNFALHPEDWEDYQIGALESSLCDENGLKEAMGVEKHGQESSREIKAIESTGLGDLMGSHCLHSPNQLV